MKRLFLLRKKSEYVLLCVCVCVCVCERERVSERVRERRRERERERIILKFELVEALDYYLVKLVSELLRK